MYASSHVFSSKALHRAMNFFQHASYPYSKAYYKMWYVKPIKHVQIRDFNNVNQKFVLEDYYLLNYNRYNIKIYCIYMVVYNLNAQTKQLHYHIY